MPSLDQLRAPAKLNLFLHVTGRRPDGYHLLQSVFVLIDWADLLHIETRDDGRLQRHDIGAALPADDLCLRAAQALQRFSGTTLGADIHIDKRIPWGAGMGGGSSDAATVLKALNALWGIDMPSAELECLALSLGADVPFFVRGQHAWVEGVGEQIQPITLPPELLDQPLAVLKPPVAVPTSAIFGHPALCRNTPRATISAFLAAPERFGRNDLQGPAQAYSSEVTQALDSMQAHFGNSRMTGSGSAVFSWMGVGSGSPTQFLPSVVGWHDPSWRGQRCRLLPDV